MNEKNNKIIVRIILYILLIATFFGIFGFSSQDAEHSSGLSEKITRFIFSPIISNLNLDSIQKEEIWIGAETFIRKLAHFTIYGIVGGILILIHLTYEISNKRRVISTLIITLIYAISDEVHQYFVPGRSMQISDVLIDFLGSLLVVSIIMKMHHVIKKGEKNEFIKKI